MTNGPINEETGQLYVGAATVDITPDGPVSLVGQLYIRISEGVDTPVEADVLVLETRAADRSLDVAIFISCDLVTIRSEVLDEVRAALRVRLPEVDPRKIVASATHTHTAPDVRDGVTGLPETGIIQPPDYRRFLVERLVAATVEAWQARRPGSVGWGLGHATIGQNRRSCYADGTAKMYGATETDDFRGMEGFDDDGVEVLCVWDADQRLVATVINLACPSQVVGSQRRVNADFWHPVREQLRAEHGADLAVLGWVSAAGDVAPRTMIRKASEERMRALRGLDHMGEIARRLGRAWHDAYEAAVMEQHTWIPFAHLVHEVDLPVRLVTAAERAEAEQAVRDLCEDPDQIRRVAWNQAIVDRFDRQSPADVHRVEVHLLRLGDIAIATNPFELFVSFGIQLKERSKALQTFVVQLVGPGTYVATAEAVARGGYSAVVQSNRVGPEGGQLLVDTSVAEINTMWPTG